MGYSADPTAITAAGNSMTTTVEETAGLRPQDRLDAVGQGLPESISAGSVAALRETWETELAAWRTDAETYAQSLRDAATTVEVVDGNAETSLTPYSHFAPEAV